MELEKKLELFGLEKFVQTYIFDLINKTVNTGKVAVALQADSDQIAIILDPPDNFNRNRLLYQLILQKTPSTLNFLAALSKTSNDHILDFIKSKLPSDIPDAPATTSVGQRIRFNLRDPILSFCGRVDFLQLLHKTIQGASLQDGLRPMTITVLSQVKIISGLGGIGKTEASLMYIFQYDDSYDNIIWINAQSNITLNDSFQKLADHLQVPSKNKEGKPLPLEQLVDAIYIRVCNEGQRTLMVFDNADDYESTKTSDGIKNFMPSYLRPELRKCPPFFLVTSRNQRWSSTMGKVQMLELEVLTKNETIDFIVNQLDLDLDLINSHGDKSIRKEVEDLAELVGGLPLALQQAVAYIRQQYDTSRILGTRYRISNFIDEFKKGMKKLQDFPLHPDLDESLSSATVFVTWNVTLTKIKMADDGETALKIIHLLAFLYADNIPVPFLLQLLPDVDPTAVARGLTLLKKYSLIKLIAPNNPAEKPDQGQTTVGSNFITIHRQLQFVILTNLQEQQGIQANVSILLNRCIVVTENIKPAQGNEVYLNIYQLLSNPFNLIVEDEEFLNFIRKLSISFRGAGQLQQALVLYQKLHQGWLKLRGEADENTLHAESQVAQVRFFQGHLQEALTICQNLLKKERIHLTEDHPNVIYNKELIVKILIRLKRFDEALELSLETLEQAQKILGLDHLFTLSTQNNIVRIYSAQGDYAKAMSICDQIEVRYTQLLGKHHRNTIVIRHNKACALLRMGNIDEGIKDLKQIYEERKLILGENHDETLRTLFWIAFGLDQQGQNQEALNMYREIHERQTRVLGEAHPITTETREYAENLLQRMMPNK